MIVLYDTCIVVSTLFLLCVIRMFLWFFFFSVLFCLVCFLSTSHQFAIISGHQTYITFIYSAMSALGTAALKLSCHRNRATFLLKRGNMTASGSNWFYRHKRVLIVFSIVFNLSVT